MRVHYQPIVVKMAFVLDCTASMGPWIHQAKTKIGDIIGKSRVTHPGAEFDIALVAYRDYDDFMRFRVVDFTTENQIVAALEQIHPEGGDDDAEDVAGALRRAFGLDWVDADVRLLFHIADAPAHGREFHRPAVSDRFPDGDPEGVEPREYLAGFSGMKVDYTFVRITTSTDKMIDVFSKVYDPSRFRVIDLHPQSYDGRYGNADYPEQLLSPAVTRMVTDSITRYTSSQGT